MMKTLLFRLMLLISITGVGGISAHATHVLKIVRINPGDTVLTDSLSPLTSKQYSTLTNKYEGNISDLILIKNGGDCKIKITDMLEGSFHSPYGALICTDSIISVPAIADFYHFFYKTKDGIEKSVGFGVNFYGVPLLDGQEIKQNDTILIQHESDLEKKITIPKNFQNNWWDVAISKDDTKKQFQMGVYEITIRKLLEEARKATSELNNLFYFSIEYYDGNGFLVNNPEWPYDDTGTSISNFTIKDGRNATGIETINSDTPKEMRIYDLQGRRLSKLQKGINIVNGKKVLIR